MRVINSGKFESDLASASRIARINCVGTIHDNDWWPDPDEEESYNWSDSIRLENGGFSRNWEQAKTVDGEVTLKVSVKFMVAADGIMYVSGTAEIKEGGVWDTTVETAKFDATAIQKNATATLLEKTLGRSDNDWATLKLEVKNDEG